MHYGMPSGFSIHEAELDKENAWWHRSQTDEILNISLINISTVAALIKLRSDARRRKLIVLDIAN